MVQVQREGFGQVVWIRAGTGFNVLLTSVSLRLQMVCDVPFSVDHSPLRGQDKAVSRRKHLWAGSCWKMLLCSSTKTVVTLPCKARDGDWEKRFKKQVIQLQNKPCRQV